MPELEVWLCQIHESLDKSGTLKPLDNCVACLRVQRDELLADVAAMAKDRERLDWLENRKYLCYGIVHIGEKYCLQIETGGDAYHGRNVREAIDAAIAQAAPEQETP